MNQAQIDLMHEAASKIERLEKENAKLRSALESARSYYLDLEKTLYEIRTAKAAA